MAHSYHGDSAASQSDCLACERLDVRITAATVQSRKKIGNDSSNAKRSATDVSVTGPLR